MPLMQKNKYIGQSNEFIGVVFWELDHSCWGLDYLWHFGALCILPHLVLAPAKQ